MTATTISASVSGGRLRRLGRRVRIPAGAIAVAIAALLVAALIYVASIPTGAATVQGVVPGDGRLIASRSIDDVRVLLVSRNGPLQVIVAYRSEKGWFGLRVPKAPESAEVAWATTGGGDPVPALSALYGRLRGVAVRVRWTDGATEEITLGTDGSFFAVHRGAARAATVSVLDAKGAVVREVRAP